MAMQIMRMKKLQTAGNVSGSLQHMLRENGKAPNADTERTMFNQNSVQSSKGGMKRFYEIEPEFKQKNNVQAIEFLVTASPEFFQDKSRSEWMNYLNDGLDWIKGLIGESNIVATSIQLDEQTPHLSVIARPIVERKFKGGKVKTALAAARYMDGSALLSKTQDDFHDNVAHSYGLGRGVKGSTARHQEVKAWYGEQAGGAARIRELESENERLTKIIDEERERFAEKLEQVEAEIEALKADSGRWRFKAVDLAFQQFGNDIYEAKTVEALGGFKAAIDNSDVLPRATKAKLKKAVDDKITDLTPTSPTKTKRRGR